MPDRRSRSPSLPLVGIALAGFVIGLLALWWLLRVPRQATSRRAGTAAATPATGVGTPVPTGPAKSEIGAFDARVARQLAASRPSVRPLGGPARFRVDAVVWNDSVGKPFFRARRVTGRIDLGAMLSRDAILRDVDVASPEVYLTRPASDTLWNYRHILAELLAGSSETGPGGRGSPPPKSVVAVYGLRVHDGFAVVRPPGYDFRFHGIDGSASRVLLSAPGLPEPVVNVATMAATMEIPAQHITEPFTVADATFRFPETGTLFDVGTLAFGSSRVTGLTGLYDPTLPGYGVRARGRAAVLHLADLEPFAPSITAEGNGSFDFAFEPTARGGIRIALSDVAFSSGASRVTGAVTLAALDSAGARLEAADLRLAPVELSLVERLTGRTLPYGGTVRGSVTGSSGDVRFDVTAHLTSPEVQRPFDVALTGEAVFGAAGFALRSATANFESLPLAAVRALAPSLPLTGELSGRVALTGAPGEAPLSLDVRFNAAGGTVLARGSVDLTGATPVYDLSGRLLGVDVRRLVTTNVPPVALTGEFTVAGRGTQPSALDARFRLVGRFTGWRTDATDRLLVRGDIAGGLLTLDTLHAGLATLTAEARGRWSLGSVPAGTIPYHLAVTDLAPFAPYLPLGAGRTASGSVELTGVLAGSLTRPQTQGTLALTGVTTQGWGAETARGEYALAFGGALPDVWVRVEGQGLTTPGGAYSSLQARVRLAAPVLSVDAAAKREDGGVLELAGSGTIPPSGGPRQVTLSRLVADLGKDRWQLAHPATATWGPGDSLVVRDLLVTSATGSGKVALSGTLLPADASDYRLEVDALPLGELFRLAGRPASVTGLLGLTAAVHGPAAMPRVSGRFSLDGGAVAGIDLSRLEGSLLYQAGRLTADAQAAFKPGGQARLTAALPLALTLGLPPQATMRDTGAVSGSFVADSVPLVVLQPLTTQATDIEGALSARMFLSGTAQEPALSGGAHLAGGALTVVDPLVNGQRYDRIQATLALADRRIRIQDLEAWSGGSVIGTGTIDFPRLSAPEMHVEFALDGFRPVNAPNQTDAGVWGQLRVEGPVAGPTVTGALRVDDGTIPLPALGSEDLLQVRLAQTQATEPLSGTAPGAAAAPGAAGPLDNLVIDGLQVTAGADLWFATEEARAQLSGTLTIDKAPRSDFGVRGELTGQRGTFTLVAGPIIRRFDVVSADIRFFGTGELNPALDITASKVILDQQGRPVDIRAHVTGTLETPRLALTTASGVEIPESELLSFLIFGQPTVALEQGQSFAGASLLEGTLFGGVAELASMQLERSLLSAGLPLDLFEIRPATGGPGATNTFGVTGATIVAGRELSPDVFLTVDYGIGVVFGGETAGGNALAARLVWRISPQWTATFGREPVNPGLLSRGLGPALAGSPDFNLSQFTVELRRRWTY